MWDAVSWWWPCRVSWVSTAVVFFPSVPPLFDVTPIISFLFPFSFFPLSSLRTATLAPAPHGHVQTDTSSHLMGKKILMCRSFLNGNILWCTEEQCVLILSLWMAVNGCGSERVLLCVLTSPSQVVGRDGFNSSIWKQICGYIWIFAVGDFI